MLAGQFDLTRGRCARSAYHYATGRGSDDTETAAAHLGSYIDVTSCPESLICALWGKSRWLLDASGLSLRRMRCCTDTVYNIEYRTHTHRRAENLTYGFRVRGVVQWLTYEAKDAT